MYQLYIFNFQSQIQINGLSMLFNICYFCYSHIFNEFISIYNYYRNTNIFSIKTQEHAFISTIASYSNLVDDKER